MRMPRKIHIATYGCQINDYESDRTYRLFNEAEGYEWTEDPSHADVVLFNTCSVRGKADQKALSEIGTLRTLKAERPEMVIAVGGCLAQIRGEEFQKRFPYVDIVFGTHQWTQLPNLVRAAIDERKKFLEIDLYGWKNYAFLPYHPGNFPHPVSELVTVQNGCDKFCTFCLVPFARGRQVSRSHAEILEEIRALADQGVREVTLLGQNVNAYGEDRAGEIGFMELLKRVAKVNGLERIRFVTSHPLNFTRELTDVMAGEEKVCEHLHLPVQSGSNRVLDRMKRDYTVDHYRKIVEYLRKRIPKLALTTDFIVGFPGETEEDFEQTLGFLREIEFDDSFSFKYSPRPHTKAAQWSGEFIAERIAKTRLARLQTLQGEIRTRKRREWVGEVVEVLVESEAKKGDGLLAGKTRQNRWVNFPGPGEWTGNVRKVKITESLSNSFRGIPVMKETQCQ